MAQRQNTILELHTMLENVITPLLTDDYDPLTINHHLQELRGIGLWPLSQKFQQVSIRGVGEKLDFYQACKRSGCSCSRFELQNHMYHIADVSRSKQRGLCLKCYKVGRVSQASGNCMRPLQTPCRAADEEDTSYH